MDVLQRFAAGDADAFETLFRERQGEVYRWIMRIVRDQGAAEDLTVETFWRMYQSRARLDPSANCRAWMRRIATNAAIDHLRRRRPMEPLEVEPAGEMPPDAAVQAETRKAIRQAVEELPPRLRVVVQLGLIEEQPQECIAEALGISPSAVKLRMYRGVRKLRKQLEERGVRP